MMLPAVNEKTRILRTEIVSITDEDGHRINQWALETLRDESVGETKIVLTPLGADWRPGADMAGPAIEFPFGEARIVAIGILRAVYYEMPQTWYLAEGDPQEYLAHLLELIYEMVPDRDADRRDGIKSLLTIKRQMERMLRLIGKARAKAFQWQGRYNHAAKWASKNHAKLVRQRQDIRGLRDKLKRIKENLIDARMSRDLSPISKYEARSLTTVIDSYLNDPNRASAPRWREELEAIAGKLTEYGEYKG